VITFTDLLAPRDRLEWLALLLKALRGLGVPVHDGTGTATADLAGTPSDNIDVVVLVLVGGEPGDGLAAVQVSANGGASFGLAVLVPADGQIDVGAGGTLTLAAGVVGPSLVKGDTYQFPITIPAFPVTSWESGDTTRTLFELDSALQAEEDAGIARLAAAGQVPTSRGPWLTVLAHEVYQEDRKEALATIGVCHLVDGGAGPFNIDPGDLVAISDSGERYRNSTGGVLPLNGTLDLEFTAEAAGADGNVPNNTIVTLGTPLPGVTINNPAGGGGTWITTSGADVEGDDSLRARCSAKWASLGPGAPSAVYDAAAKKSSAEVTRAKSTPSLVTPGEVDVLLAGDGGPVSGGAVAAVQAYIDANVAPLCVAAVVASAVAYAITVTATINVAAAQLAAAQAEGEAGLQKTVNAIAIGGTIYASPLIEALQAPSGVRDVAGLQVEHPPATPIGLPHALAANEVPVLTLNLTWNGI
jgi:uncharacterized phage protein gp47/JayE